MEEKAGYVYYFKNKRVRKAFNMYALEHDTSIQELIDQALKIKHSDLFRKDIITKNK